MLQDATHIDKDPFWHHPAGDLHNIGGMALDQGRPDQMPESLEYTCTHEVSVPPAVAGYPRLYRC